MYLGFEGDIRSRGATGSNHWFYESFDISDGLWAIRSIDCRRRRSMSRFRRSSRGPSVRLTTSPQPSSSLSPIGSFSRWESSQLGQRPADYLALKETISGLLMAQFARHFPVAPLVVHVELSTPLSSVAFTAAEHGGVYGLEASPRRFMSGASRAKTPVTGLYLAGQDVASAGIMGAMTAECLPRPHSSRGCSREWGEFERVWIYLLRK